MAFRNFFNFVLSSIIIYSILLIVPCAYNTFALCSAVLVGINLAEWLMASTRIYFFYKTVNPKNKALLITGCDSGFGNAIARRMDKLGFKVFAACLNAEGGGAKDLEMACSDKLSVLQLDVTNERSILTAREFVEKNLGQCDLWAVVNNAGIAHIGEIDWTSVDDIQQVYDVNTTGILRVTKIFLPLIKKSKGRIVNTTSTGGRVYVPGSAGYSMSKSAAIALTTGLRIELAKWGVKAISIEPFYYRTPMTGGTAVGNLFEKAWEKAPDDIKEEYGEEYKKSIEKNVSQSLNTVTSPNVSIVIDCFEDALTAEEPLSTYFPCPFILKLVLKIGQVSPSCIIETILRYSYEKFAKPAALMSKKKKL